MATSWNYRGFVSCYMLVGGIWLPELVVCMGGIKDSPDGGLQQLQGVVITVTVFHLAPCHNILDSSS